MAIKIEIPLPVAAVRNYDTYGVFNSYGEVFSIVVRSERLLYSCGLVEAWNVPVRNLSAKFFMVAEHVVVI